MSTFNELTEIHGRNSEGLLEKVRVYNHALSVNINAQPVKMQVDASSADAFARLRTSEPFTIFESKMINDKQSLFFDEVTNGTVYSNYLPGHSAVEMGVLDTGDYVIRQTKMRFNYQPGKSQLVLLTGVIGDPIPNTEAKIGYFNTSNTAPYTAGEDGLYYGVDGTSVYIAVAKSDGAIQKINQADWDDPLDGTGASGITADWNSTNIFGIDFEWLGVGSVRFFLFVDGMPVMVHQVNNANVGQTSVYMTSPNHSVRYEIRSTGGEKEIRQICSSVMSEGGINPSGITRSINNGITPVVCGIVEEGILFFRTHSSRPCTTLELSSFSVLNSSNNANNYKWSIILNPTIGGTPPTFTQESGSAIDWAVGTGDNTITGGLVLDSGYVAGDVPSLPLPTDLIINPGVSIAGSSDVVALSIQTFSGTDSFVGSFNVRELTCG